MTQPLVSPGETFLAQDPHAAFLASGDPQRFLEDNLPSAGEVVAPTDHLVRNLALGIAAAFLGWRMLASRRLAQLPPPTQRDAGTRRLLGSLAAAEWMALAVPVLREHLITVGDITAPQAEAAATAYAASLGDYLHETSAEALIAGYTAELANGVSPELAWARVAEGYGLTAPQMRSWLIAQRQLPIGYADKVVSDPARKALDRAFLQRADTLGRNEAWGARQTGRSVVWMAQQEAGELPETARKKWITADDEFVCPVCAPLHKQEVGLRERFVLPTGAKVWAPGIHPHCRCEIVLVRPNLVQRLLGKAEVAKVLPPVDELAELRRQRRLRQLNPNHPAVRAKLAKARGDDRYDRDRKGRFARDEMRMTVLDRPEPKTEEVVDTTPKVEIDPFTGLPLTSADPFAAVAPVATADPFAQIATADPFAQVATADPFAQIATADPFAPPQPTTGVGGGTVIVFINGKAERVPDDRLIMAPVDWYLAAYDNGYSSDATAGMGGLIGTDDVGKVIDFDEWHQEYVKRAQDKDLPGFPAYVIPTNHGREPLVDFLANQLDDDDQGIYDDEYYQYRAEAMEAALSDPDGLVASLNERDLRRIYLDAGRSDDARHLSTDEMRDGLLEVLNEDYLEDAQATDMFDALSEYIIEDDEVLQAMEAESIHRNQGSYARVPQVFSFTGGGFRQDYVGDGSDLRVYGKFRIAEVKTHSFTREALDRDPRSGQWYVKDANSLPPIGKWQEIVLEPVDE